MHKYRELLEKEVPEFIEKNLEHCCDDPDTHKLAKDMMMSLWLVRQLDDGTVYHINKSFTEHDARHWVEHMNPPAKWSKEETTKIAEANGIKFDHISECDFWAVMNMMYSDYGHTIGKYVMGNDTVYVELAKDFLFDADSKVTPKEKVMLYYNNFAK